MALNKVYTRINWEDYPSENTDLDAYNLNQMDSAIDALDNRIISQDALKVDKSAINGNIADWTMDEATGVITITKYNGEKVIFDLNIEKIPVGFSMSDDGIVTMTTEDGTQFTADIGSMIPVLTFEDSATIAVSVTGTGKNKTYSFSIKSGSVTGDMLQPNYLADVTVQAGKASGSASDAANSAKAAKTSETNAKSSETAAKTSENNSATNAETATKNATSASTSATNAANSAKAAKTSETNAKSSETAAKTSATNAKTSETNALSSKNSSSTSASTAQKNANLSKSYAVGGTGTRNGEDTDNAKYYMEQAKKQTGGIPTKVSELKNDAGYITKSVSDLTNYYDKTNVDKKIDAIPKTDLTNYLTKTGDGSNLTAAFEEATTLEELTTGEKLSSVFGKLKLAVKNLKSLINLIGTTDISAIGDGTVTGGLSDVNSKLSHVGELYQFTLGSSKQDFVKNKNELNTSTKLPAGRYLFTLNGVHESAGVYNIYDVVLNVDGKNFRIYYGSQGASLMNLTVVCDVSANCNIDLYLYATNAYTTYSVWEIQATRIK